METTYSTASLWANATLALDNAKKLRDEALLQIFNSCDAPKELQFYLSNYRYQPVCKPSKEIFKLFGLSFVYADTILALKKGGYEIELTERA